MAKAKPVKTVPARTPNVDVSEFDREYTVCDRDATGRSLPYVCFPKKDDAGEPLHGQPKVFYAGDVFNGLEWPYPEVTIPDALADGWIVASGPAPIVEKEV